MTDRPIDPQDYLYGFKVVQIDDLRVARGLTRRPKTTCQHKQVVYDESERRIWCKDCESDVDPFDAFIGVCSVWASANNQLERRQRAVDEAEAFTLISRAAKVMDEAWRRKKMVPCCPHCHEALLPDDVLKRGLSMASRELVEQRRKKNKEVKP